MAINEKLDIKEHPELIKAKPAYTAIRTLIEEDIEQIRGYLLKHDTEKPNTTAAKKAWESRLLRTYHKAVISAAHEIHKSHLTQDVSWGGIEKSEIADILEDVSGELEPAEEFIIKVIGERVAFGRVGVLVDAPEFGPNLTRAENIDNRSYEVMYKAEHILYWRYQKIPNMRSQLVEVILRDRPDIMPDGTQIPRLRRLFLSYRLDAAGNAEPFVLVQILEEKKNNKTTKNSENGSSEWYVVMERPLDLPTLPFVIWGRGLEDSLYKKVWHLETSSFNLGSVRTNIIYRQGFKRVIVTGAKETELKRMNESIVNRVSNPDAQVHVIPEGDPTAATEECRDVDSRAQRMALLQHNQLVEDTKQVQSAESKAKDMIGRERYYNSILNGGERVFSFVWWLHQLFEGVATKDKPQISFARVFGLRSVDEIAQERSSLINLSRVASTAKVLKSIFKTMVSEATLVPTDDQTEAELKKDLFAEIDSSEPFGTTGGLAGVQGAQQQNQNRLPIAEQLNQDGNQ